MKRIFLLLLASLFCLSTALGATKESTGPAVGSMAPDFKAGHFRSIDCLISQPRRCRSTRTATMHPKL
jgi:hypothetical protein